jgi:hypothetical protein
MKCLLFAILIREFKTMEHHQIQGQQIKYRLYPFGYGFRIHVKEDIVRLLISCFWCK